jgi:hypothetical protein
VAGAPFGSLHPGAYLPGRRVPHVLSMSALQLGDPVPFHVLPKADDTSLDHCEIGSWPRRRPGDGRSNARFAFVGNISGSGGAAVPA